jgi:hypothetical protein
MIETGTGPDIILEKVRRHMGNLLRTKYQYSIEKPQNKYSMP